MSHFGTSRKISDGTSRVLNVPSELHCFYAHKKGPGTPRECGRFAKLGCIPMPGSVRKLGHHRHEKDLFIPETTKDMQKTVLRSQISNVEGMMGNRWAKRNSRPVDELRFVFVAFTNLLSEPGSINDRTRRASDFGI